MFKGAEIGHSITLKMLTQQELYLIFHYSVQETVNALFFITLHRSYTSANTSTVHDKIDPPSSLSSNYSI